MKKKLAATGFVVAVVTLLNIAYFAENNNYNPTKRYYEVSRAKASSNGFGKYLINTTNCQIPDIGAFNEDILQFVGKEEYTKCTELPLLTYIEKSFGVITLNINTTLLPQYSSYDVTCCYSEIHRVEDDDDSIWFTPCKSFKESAVIYTPFIKVVCRNTFFIKVYENVHAAALLDDAYTWDPESKSPFSVLLVGIDSISKQNLERAMPKSYTYLENHFISLKGYTKVGINTFPNLMAILTGLNEAQRKEKCPFSMHGANKDKYSDVMSNCHIIWEDFNRSGYVTAFAEDYCSLSTFNYDKKGFPKPPTHYYYRPYYLAVEQLSSVGSDCHTKFCTGPENTGERIFNNAKDFSVTFKDQPSFGLFWTNTFSHDNVNCPSAMDDKVLAFLSSPKFVDSLKNTIMVFFSDHGFRFGESRHTNSGWLEERLPFIFIRIPERFRLEFPREYQNFLMNSYRLTTGYDLYNTLQHVLQLYNSSYDYSSLGCSTCHSLFKEIAERRTCEDAGIHQNWCTCTSYAHMPTTDPLVQKIAVFVVEEVNKRIKTFPERKQCGVYSLDVVHSAGVSEVRLNAANVSVNYILMMIKAIPQAMFEVTVEVAVDSPDKFVINGDISRIDRYADHSFCVRDSELRRFCYCDGSINLLRSKICSKFGIC